MNILAGTDGAVVSGAVRETFSVTVIDRAELSSSTVWSSTFADKRKDYRYYEITEDTLREGYDYRYFAIRDASGRIRAIQPFFLLDQDILEGVGSEWRLISFIRRRYPRFLKMRTLMVGCSAGEGHLAACDDLPAASVADVLSRHIRKLAKNLGAQLIVLKEFPASYRETFECFVQRGFGRAPSMPMTKLNIEYENFDHFIEKALSGKARKNVRRNLQASAGEDIRMTVTDGIENLAEEIYPLYLQVYERSKFRFEKLTEDYFRDLGTRMKDKVRVFTWHRGNTLVAFNICMVQGEHFFSEYVGFDYSVALNLHLYFHIVRDTINWAIQGGYRWFRSSGLNYDPKLHLRHQLDPIDLYVRHVSPIANEILKRVLPWIVPARYDATLKKFKNYSDIW